MTIYVNLMQKVNTQLFTSKPINHSDVLATLISVAAEETLLEECKSEPSGDTQRGFLMTVPLAGLWSWGG